MANSRVVMTPEFRMSYPNLISPKEFIDRGKKTGKFNYTVEMLYAEADLKKFQVLRDGKLVDVDLPTLLVELAKEAWGTEINPETNQPFTVKEMFAGAASKGWPIRKGDTVADVLKAKGKEAEHYRGLKVISAKSVVNDKVQPPALSIAQKGGALKLNRNVEADLNRARSAFLGGNYAFAELNIVAATVAGGRFLTPYLNSIRYTRDGVRFGGQGGSLMERFAGVAGGESAHNPTDGLDDEIPF